MLCLRKPLKNNSFKLFRNTRALILHLYSDLVLLAQCDNERSRPDAGPALKALERGALRDAWQYR